ncbi:MAG: SafA/ExsA family spore coat assembly protein [Bacillota bacterium]|nr:SafA/ExsA family spore coat assembly protein [Bacillota bacterium]
MQHYIVEKGDTLWLIAKRFGVSLEELIRANPQIKDPNKIYPGNRINIPLPSESGMSVYTVRPGDTMWLIAKKFGISLERLLKANPQIKDPDRIDVGQKIFIPQGGSGGGGGGTVYTVRPGDTMWNIAKKFGISLGDLIKANPQIKDPNLIFPGQVLNIPGGGAAPMPPAPPMPPMPPMPPAKERNGRLYIVKSGDTFFHIAQRYALNLESLILANPQIKDPDRIVPGMQLYLPGVHVVKRGDTIFSIARMHGVSQEALLRINPQIKDPNRIDVGQKIYIPRMPNGDMALYTVEQGDTLHRIAEMFGLAVEAITNANPQITDPDRIFPGQRLRIPGPHQVQQGQTLTSIANLYGVDLDALLAANPQIEDPDMIFPWTMVRIPSMHMMRRPQNTVGVDYVVQPGDTLYEIAGLYHVSLENLIKANPQIKNPDMIFPGQVVRIPIGFTDCTCYTVKQGDTLYKIARMYGVSVNAIIRANPRITNPNYIEPGWILMIPLRGGGCMRDEESESAEMEEERMAQSEMTEHPRIYVVQKGDSLYSIAHKFNVTVKQLMMANPEIKDADVIYPGQQIIVLPADMVCEYRCLDCPWFLRNRE